MARSYGCDDSGPSVLTTASGAIPEKDDGGPLASTDGQVVARNFSALLLSQAMTWSLAVAATIVLPRYLGAEQIGRLHAANSLWTIVSVAATFGMYLLLPKLISRDPSRAESVIATSLALRLILLLPATTVLALYVHLVGYPADFVEIIAIVGGGAVITMAAAAFGSGLQGLEHMGPLSLATVADRTIATALGIGAVILGLGVHAVAAVAAVGAAANLTVCLRAFRKLRRATGTRSRFHVGVDDLTSMLRSSAPYFGVFFLITAYREVDAIVISAVVADARVLGWYSVFDRFFGTLAFIPAVFIGAAYPTLARRFAGDDGDPRKVADQCFRIMLLAGVPLGFGFAVMARPLFELLLGDEFVEAAVVMSLGGVVVPITYLNAIFGFVLIAMDRQDAWYKVLAAATVAVIALDLVLIPGFQSRYGNGAIGGAFTYLITESLMLIAAIRLLPRGSVDRGSLWFAARIVAAGLAMVAVVYPLRTTVLPVPIAAGALAYGAVVLGSRAVTKEQRDMALDFVRSAARATRA